MAETIASLLVRLGADASEFTRVMASADGKMQDVGKRMTSIGGSLSTRVTAPLVAVGAAAFASAVKVGNMADKLFDLSDQTGLSTTSLQEFRRVAVVAGVGTDTIASAAQGLTRRLSATGEESKKFSGTLEAIGVSTRDAAGEIRSMDALMPEIITSLQGMDNTVERNAAAFALFGGKATELMPILGMAAGSFDELRGEAHSLGMVMSEDALNAANDFRVGWDTLKASMGAAAMQLGTAVIPVMGSLVSVMQSSVVPAITSAVTWFSELSPGVKTAAFVVGGLVAALGPLALAIGAVVAVLPALAAGMAVLLGPVGLVSAAVVGLGVVWLKWGDDIKAAVSGAVTSVTEWFGRLAAPFEAVKAGVESVTGVFRNMYDRVVGNSYVPDMVDGIAMHFARLDAIMVAPAISAAEQVNAAFAGIKGPNVSGGGGMGGIASSLLGMASSLNPMTMATNMALSAASGIMRGLISRGASSIFGSLFGRGGAPSASVPAPPAPARPPAGSSSSNVPGGWDAHGARRAASGGAPVTIVINNPPPAMDVVAIARQVKQAISEDRRRGGTAEWDVGLGVVGV